MENAHEVCYMCELVSPVSVHWDHAAGVQQLPDPFSPPALVAVQGEQHQG